MAVANGFWGNPDSIQDWCEPNYAITIYIAEFFNTISSLPMIFLGLIGIYYTRKIAKLDELRYTLCFITLSLVGIGSTLFHGTLRWHFQLLDELPMLFCNWLLLYVIIQNKTKRGAPPNRRLIIFFGSILMITCIGYVVFQIWHLFLYNYCFGTLLQWLLLIPYLKNQCFSCKTVLVVLGSYYGGMTFWLIDFYHCALVQPFHFHAIWHIAAGYGTYVYLLAMVILRTKQLKEENLKLDFQKCPFVIHSIQRIKQHEI